MIYDLPELYDAQYRTYRDDLHFYRRLADDYGSPILELGAGTARVSIALAQAGHRVVGIEASEKMLEQGRARIVEENLNHTIHLHHADMRQFDLEQQFPLIIAPFNVLAHAYTLQDQDAVFSSVKAHLSPQGMFALDMFNPNFHDLNVLKRADEWAHVGGERSELFVYQTHDADAQIIASRYYLDQVLEDGSLTRQTAQLRQRYYTRFELERALKHAGFETIQFFGNFDKGRYSHSAAHLIALAR